MVLEKVTETRTVWRGLGRVAKHCGVTRAHLSYVLHGHRKAGPKLTAKLAKLGIVVEEIATIIELDEEVKKLTAAGTSAIVNK